MYRVGDFPAVRIRLGDVVKKYLTHYGWPEWRANLFVTPGVGKGEVYSKSCYKYSGTLS